jgi:microcystin-dependent protein
MRIVTGSVVNGGSVNFTTAFASQTPTGSVSISSVSGSAGATTLTTPQIPSHTHTLVLRGDDGGPFPALQATVADPTFTNITTSSTGGGGSHTHPFSFSSGSGTFSGNAINLAVKYYDFIIASKD